MKNPSSGTWQSFNTSVHATSSRRSIHHSASGTAGPSASAPRRKSSVSFRRRSQYAPSPAHSVSLTFLGSDGAYTELFSTMIGWPRRLLHRARANARRSAAVRRSRARHLARLPRSGPSNIVAMSVAHAPPALITLTSSENAPCSAAAPTRRHAAAAATSFTSTARSGMCVSERRNDYGQMLLSLKISGWPETPEQVGARAGGCAHAGPARRAIALAEGCRAVDITRF